MRIRLGCEMRYAIPYPVPMVVMLNVHPTRADALEAPDTLRTDPLGLESAWRSTTGRYINMRLALKAGAKDNGEMGRQTVGVKCDTLRMGSREQFTFTLLHNQNGVPEYYTQVAFVSIPLDERAQEADIVVRVNTYGGLLEHRY